jgi:hypothetical protein
MPLPEFGVACPAAIDLFGAITGHSSKCLPNLG